MGYWSVSGTMKELSYGSMWFDSYTNRRGKKTTDSKDMYATIINDSGQFKQRAYTLPGSARCGEVITRSKRKEVMHLSMLSPRSGLRRELHLEVCPQGRDFDRTRYPQGSYFDLYEGHSTIFTRRRVGILTNYFVSGVGNLNFLSIKMSKSPSHARPLGHNIGRRITISKRVCGALHFALVRQFPDLNRSFPRSKRPFS